MFHAVHNHCGLHQEQTVALDDSPSRDGREALRKLDAEYRHTYRGRQMALLRRIVHPKLNSAGSGRGVHQRVVRVAAGGARVRTDIWQ